jgi:hypothetical protein
MLTMSVASLSHHRRPIHGRPAARAVSDLGFDPDPPWIARFLALPVLVGVVPASRRHAVLSHDFPRGDQLDYVRTARAKGCGMRASWCGTGCNALIPILTNVVVQILSVHRRAAARVFLRHPGARRLDGGGDPGQRLLDAAHHGLSGALLFILGQILTDISYALADLACGWA